MRSPRLLEAKAIRERHAGDPKYRRETFFAFDGDQLLGSLMYAQVENTTLRCRRHNQGRAEREIGSKYMVTWKQSRKRAGSAATPGT